MTPSRADDARPLATSDTLRIRVDAIPVEDVPGTLGITFAPGKKVDGAPRLRRRHRRTRERAAGRP